ncbi:ionotropic receptor 93a [Lasioglossum baleicum]|uniref:ionotropic receptor 93a n=1 Tax=Lasioglossum baleicum TaxID=434251 RepID=UPI003FCD2047
MLSVLFVLSYVNYGASYNDFPSLTTANASMAVVIDKSFFSNKEEHRNVVESIHDLIAHTVKKEMHVGGIVVHLFQDTNVILRQDYTILLSVATCYLTWRLHEAARSEDIMHFAITDADCPRLRDTDGISIPMVKPGEELSQIFLDLRMMDILSWNAINVLHDESFDRDMVSRVMMAISDKLPTKHVNLISRSIFTLKQNETDRARKALVHNTLSDFHVDQLGHCFLVIATTEIVPDVMDVARSLKMVHPGSQWLYVITDSAAQNSTNMTAFVDLLAEGGNVAFVYNATDTDGFCEVKLMRYIKRLVKAVARALEASVKKEIEMLKRIGDEDFEIVRLTKRERRHEVLKNVRIYAAEDNNKECPTWKFTTAITWGNFFFRGRNQGHMLDIGVWTPGFSVNLTDMLFPHIAHGFRGISLPIATYSNPPWQVITISSTGEKTYEGLVFDVVKHLGKKLNFTYTVIAPELNKTANSWVASRFDKLGDKVKGMTMSNTRQMPQEVIELVRQKKVLLAAVAYTVNEDGKNAINFTVPIYVQTYSFLTARPRQLSRALLFASPFTEQTWACLAVSTIIMGPILYMIHKCSPYSTQTSGLNSSFQCVWYVYGALLQQGGMYLPQSDSARFLIGVWWLIVMVIVATYSGSLVAFLTFPRMDASILTVEDLIGRRDRMTWGFLNGSFLEVYLQNAEETKYHILLARAEKYNNTEDEKMIGRVKEGKHALIDWRSSLRFLMRKDLLLTGGCHFSLSQDEFLNEPIAMIIPEGSPYLPVINAELRRMLESGLMHKWITERMPIRDKCWEMAGNNQVVNERKVNVADMQGIFFVLFMGVTLSFFFLFCEFYWHRRKVSKERKLIRPFVSKVETLHLDSGHVGINYKDVIRSAYPRKTAYTLCSKQSASGLHARRVGRPSSSDSDLYINMGTTVSWTILLHLLPTLVRGYDNVGFDGWYQPVPHRPVDIITDVINDLGVRILQQYTVPGNVAFSPAGVGFVLAALYEGSAGRGRQQISDALGLPRDRDVTRLGFRDVHRRLRTYLNADGFLGGLTLNQEDTKLRPEYEGILRFYGFDLTIPEEESNATTNAPESTTNQPTMEVETPAPDDATATTMQPIQDASSESTPPTTLSVELLGMTMTAGEASSRLTQTTFASTILTEATKVATLPSEITTVSTSTMSEIATTIASATDASASVTDASTSAATTATVPPATMVDTATQNAGTESLATSTGSISPVTDLPAATDITVLTEAATETMTSGPTTVLQDTSPDTTATESTTATTIATTIMTEATPAASNIDQATTTPVPANLEASSSSGPPAEENTVATEAMKNQTSEMGSTDLPATTVANEIGSDGQPTTLPATVTDSMTRRKRAARSPRGFFSSYPDEGIWMQDLGIWNPYPTSLSEASVRDSTEISFLVNGCDVSSVTASRYFAVLPFAHFPSLHAVALEFPLDDPRYNILLVMSTDRRDTYRLSRDLGGKSLRLLRKQLQATWVRATIPSFMLRGFVTLTSFLQRLGIVDVFEPRAADLSLMTPDLGVYARDVQQSIGVNIRNYMKPDRTHSRESPNSDPPLIVPPRRDYYRYYHPGNGLFERAGPVVFTAVHPFLYFIVDAETSVALIAGRVNDPLNSRIL